MKQIELLEKLGCLKKTDMVCGVVYYKDYMGRNVTYDPDSDMLELDTLTVYLSQTDIVVTYFEGEVEGVVITNNSFNPMFKLSLYHFDC